MNTTALPKPKRRRRHTAQFKARVVSECLQPNISIAGVALSNGLNANLLRRWIEQHRGEDGSVQPVPAVGASNPGSRCGEFVALSMANHSTAVEAAKSIRIEIERRGTRIAVTWPVDAASACSDWLREVLR